MRNVDTSIAAALAIIGFVVAVLSGLGAGQTASSCLTSGLVAIPVCYLVGSMISRAARVAVEEYVAQQTSSQPIPNIEQEISRLDPEGEVRGLI